MSAKPYSVASVLAGIGMTVPPYCRCGAPVRRPADRCETCRDAESAERRAAMIRTRVEARVPAAFRWGALGEGTDLHRAMAQPHLMRDIVEWLAGPSSPPVLLLRGGETKALKSSVAGACVRHETEAGRESFFVLAVDLAPLGERPEESQREARSLALRRVNNTRALVVLDDISKVFGGATADAGMAAYRRADLVSTIHRRCSASARTIVTTDLENRAGECGSCEGRGRVDGVVCATCKGFGKVNRPGIVELFGEDVMSRLTDPRDALVLRLRRKQDSGVPAR